MVKGTPAPMRTSEHLSYLWLAIAAASTLVAAGRWSIPLAAWLAPLFLLRFVRTRRVLAGLLLAWLIRAAVTAVAAQGTILVPGIGYYVVIVFAALVTTLPFLVDRLITPQLHGFV